MDKSPSGRRPSQTVRVVFNRLLETLPPSQTLRTEGSNGVPLRRWAATEDKSAFNIQEPPSPSQTLRTEGSNGVSRWAKRH